MRLIDVATRLHFPKKPRNSTAGTKTWLADISGATSINVVLSFTNDALSDAGSLDAAVEAKVGPVVVGHRRGGCAAWAAACVCCRAKIIEAAEECRGPLVGSFGSCDTNCLTICGSNGSSIGPTTLLRLPEVLADGTTGAPERCADVTQACSLDVVCFTNDISHNTWVDTHAIEAPIRAIEFTSSGCVCAGWAATGVSTT